MGRHKRDSCVHEPKPPPDDLERLLKGLFREGELAQIYSDWRIEFADSYIFEDQHLGGNIHHRHAINKIVARKCNGSQVNFGIGTQGNFCGESEGRASEALLH